MKKNYFIVSLVVLFFCVTTTIGQTVITHANHAPFIGYSATSMTLEDEFEPLDINPGPSGSNQSWNFSSFTAEVQEQMIYVNPASTPFADQIAGTDINLALTFDDEEESGFAFMNVSSNGLVFRAMGIMENGMPVTLAFLDPSPTIMQFPFAYQNTMSTYGEMEMTQDDFTILTKVWLTMEADAWGTITTPHATFNNALRIEVTSNDSTFFYMGGNLLFSFGFLSVDYLWYSSNHRNSVFEINGEYIDGEYEAWRINYFIGETVGIEQAPLPSLVKAYPNPASDQLSVEYPASEGNLVIRLNDLSGRQVFETILNQSSGKSDFDVSGVSKGVYILQMIKDNQILGSKKIVVR